MYGMNFHNMPELGCRWGYLCGLALIASAHCCRSYGSRDAGGGKAAEPSRQVQARGAVDLSSSLATP
jgi:hypothetical protein